MLDPVSSIRSGRSSMPDAWPSMLDARPSKDFRAVPRWPQDDSKTQWLQCDLAEIPGIPHRPMPTSTKFFSGGWYALGPLPFPAIACSRDWSSDLASQTCVHQCALAVGVNIFPAAPSVASWDPNPGGQVRWDPCAAWRGAHLSRLSRASRTCITVWGRLLSPVL